jgi:predicted amidohydrolase YtcJ
MIGHPHDQRASGRRAFLGGKVLTMDSRDTVAQGVVVADGRITAVGADADLRQSLSSEDEVVELDGRVLIPGFVDAHCHLELTTAHLSYATLCFVPPHSTIEDILQTLRAAAAQASPSDPDWIIGRTNFSVQLFVEEKRQITRADLDRAVSDRPVALFAGIHFVTLNTRALELTGLLDGRALPRGSLIDLESGRGAELWDWLPLPTFGVDGVAAAIADRGRSIFQANGVTSVAEIPYSHDGIRAMQKLNREGRLPVRLDLRYHAPRICTINQLAALGLETGMGDDWLRMGGLKVFVDGAGADLEGNEIEDIKWSQAELDEMVLRSHLAGLQVMLHVQCERSLRMALDAIERAVAAHPREDHRHRIEHAGDLPVGDHWWERIARAGVIPVATPQFIYSYGDWFPEANNPRLRTQRVRYGLRVPGNSDSTGSQPEAANPFHGIWCAMARRTRSGTILSAHEAIDLRDALRMCTADAAFACHMDDRGTIEVGKLADLVVLGQDPETVDIDDLPSIPVDLTVLGGVPLAPARDAAAATPGSA